MDNDSHTLDQNEDREEGGGGILRRIEEKLDRLLGPREEDWHEREWAPLDSPIASYDPGDPSPRLYVGAAARQRASTAGRGQMPSGGIQASPAPASTASMLAAWAPMASIRSHHSTARNGRRSLRTALRENIIC